MHTLVAAPTEDLDSWLDLVTMCRKEGMHVLCENLLRQLGAPIMAKSRCVHMTVVLWVVVFTGVLGLWGEDGDAVCVCVTVISPHRFSLCNPLLVAWKK